MACEGQLQDLQRSLREMTTRDGARNEVLRLLHQIATAMERTAEKLRTQLGVPSLFVSPPGMLYWGGMFQQFVYMLSEVCQAHSIRFYLCAPNLRVSKTDLGPAALSAHAYLAAISRLLQPVEKGGNAQLTWDDAVFYDHGMRLGTLTFDENGNRTRPEATLKERENMRRYNWLVRKAHPNTINADLAAVWDQIGRWPLNREIERTIPQTQFANKTEIIKMPLGVRHLVAQEAVTLDEQVQAREVTYGDWYQDRLATVTLEMAARGLSASFPALLTSLGLGWHLDVIAAEFCLTDDRLKKLTDLLQRTTVNEVLALTLALCLTKFVAGPLAILVDLTTTGGILEFYTYLVLAQGKLTSLLGSGEVLFLQNGHNYTDHLFRMRDSVQHCLYSTLIYASGLIVGVDQAQPLHHPDAQLPRENAGFPLPQHLADLTLAEVEDLVPVIVPVLIPIFGALGVLRYPTKPVSMAVQVATVSIFTYLQGSPTMSYECMIQKTLSGKMPQAYTTIKTELQAEENMMGVIRARPRKAAVLPRGYGPVNWYNAPMDLHGQPFRFPWTVDLIKKTINSSLDASPTVRSDYKFKFIKVPNHYWKEPVGYPRARPIARGQELLNHQLRHTDCANVPQWISVAAQVRDRNLSRLMAPIQYEPVWRPQGRMTMSGDMPLTLLDIVNQVLGAEIRAEWDDECLHLEVTNFEIWKKACALWKQSGWISKRVPLAAHHRAEEERAQRYAPAPSQSTAAPIMAMSLEQTLTVEAASLEDEVTVETAMPVAPSPTGEHTAELTPYAALADPIGQLTIDIEAETRVPSPTRRVSTSDASPPKETLLVAETGLLPNDAPLPIRR